MDGARLAATFATRLNSMGMALHIVERYLNHALPGMMSTYNRQTIPERREALDAGRLCLAMYVVVSSRGQGLL